MLDDSDRRLLRQLQNDPAASLQALAARSGVSVQFATRRLDRLRAQGVLRGQRARIDWRALGYDVAVSLRFTIDKTDPRAFEDFLAAARAVPEVVEIQTFLGRVDLRLSVVARDLAHYHEVYRHRILALPHIAEIEALMQVATLKTDERLPL
ncbi:Lrp/AsnC family transcriptional regulator [Palleronia sediminis]|uniref:Lrp/AsnC family transcriptional regulator n=1 Tax=Palleronia sediminis TaxID=2547833 RepID=A0A4R6A7P3_9RHOB|nr:Lrp/AsnC family transcriptional regulator [Palleronia sediminis]TDL79791.1 Lrp/AsnC family transcriptional regulator [Palleronia sediminis]